MPSECLTIEVSQEPSALYDNNLYEPINDKLLSWQRILSGLYYEKTAKSFVELIKPYNSGTYDNQWIVFDLNAWKKDKKEALFICEQMPGLMLSEDVVFSMTEMFRQVPSTDTDVHEKTSNPILRASSGREGTLTISSTG